MHYVSTADTGMKTGNVESLQAPSMLEIAPAELWERRKRLICASKCALLKGFLPAVCVSAMVPISASSQGCSLPRAAPRCEGSCRAGFPSGWSDQEYSHSHGSFSSQAGEKGAESSSVSSKPGARRYSQLGEPGNDPGVHSTCPSPPAFPKGRAYLGLGSPVPSVDGVSITAGASCGHGLVMSSQIFSSGKAAWEEGGTGLTAIAQLPPDTGKKNFTNLPGGIIAPDASPPVSPAGTSPFFTAPKTEL